MTRSGDAFQLRHCQGYAVDSPRGFVGFVEWVRFDSRLDRPDAIAVREVPDGLRLFVVGPEDVARVVAGEQRLVLRREPRSGRMRLRRRPRRPRAA
jgi:hypothetical protein